MPYLRTLANGCGLAALLMTFAGATVTADDSKPWELGSSVVLTGCVERAQNPGDDDEVVVTDVAEVPLSSAAALRPMPREPRVYWFDDTGKIDDHIGARVRITGKLDKIEKQEMEVKRRKGTVLVKIKGDGDDITVTPQQAGVAPPSPGKKEGEIPYWMLKLDVKNVEKVSETCR